MRSFCEAFDIEHGQCWVCYGLAEHRFSIRLECRLKFFIRASRRDEGEFDAHARHGVREQIVSTAIDRGRAHHVVATSCDVEDGKEIRCLPRRSEHGSTSAFEFTDLRGNGVVRGILQAGIEVSSFLKVEELPHELARVVLPGSALVDRDLTWLCIARMITALHACCSDLRGHECS